MNLFRKKVFVVYKEYRNWEDDDCNGTEIINVSSNGKKSHKNIIDDYNEELQFFAENKMKIIDKNCSDIGYYIETENGNVEGYTIMKEVS